MKGTRPPDDDANGEVADQNRKKLLSEFGSILDESLILLVADERDIVGGYEEIRQVLNVLTETAREEAATGFDPSGLSSASEIGEFSPDDTATSGHGVDSSAECTTTISEFSDRSEGQRLTEQTNLSEEQKIQELKLVFGDGWGDHTIRFILKQSEGDLERAFDALLVRQFLKDEGSLPKGVDGFFVSDEDCPSPKGRGSRARKGNAKNKKQTVTINYNAVLSTVDDGELEGAKDFAAAAKSRVPAARPRLPPFTALPLKTTFAQQPALTSVSPVTTDFASEMRAAAALRRMGPLGRQGAVVYTERARDGRAAFTANVSREAEAHVAQQSTSTMLDLHGVFVMDGVRIAKQRVWNWWNNLGEDRKTLAKRNGFTVVTGVGKHSAGGVSRLRQAVGAYLKNDGWKMETLTGSFYVTGRA
ncbi:hypothetical protein CHGG_09273 [Chaetomium globosum CBS 148.51]|uniref:Smr domain-containing protein n=1 Tax=Chaetomium globosum (strain ATCC 6205 / CBS 148.51 / DSM 1962 / NBRC 6347 / NRRL 1970) TaxID=306901 RepID=Q2GRY1_CHAGB|nr:uncharacterized protein CHGG_09273 [Chaetomium globosum CBS 148.51]EAQ85259.1 hypothetical protein CHGG_09273 [Chaetomium globosum CBS 148.51]